MQENARENTERQTFQDFNILHADADAYADADTDADVWDIQISLLHRIAGVLNNAKQYDLHCFLF